MEGAFISCPMPSSKRAQSFLGMLTARGPPVFGAVAFFAAYHTKNRFFQTAVPNRCNLFSPLKIDIPKIAENVSLEFCTELPRPEFWHCINLGPSKGPKGRLTFVPPGAGGKGIFEKSRLSGDEFCPPSKNSYAQCFNQDCVQNISDKSS